MELNKDQSMILNDIISRLNIIKTIVNCDTNLITVGGYAGTGKTTLISELRKEIDKQAKYLPVAFTTLTGKASSVLFDKLNENGAQFSIDYCGTIHGLIYKPDKMIWNKKLKTYIISGWKLKTIEELEHYQIIIIDESSMVSKDIWKDLSKFNITIIAFGDHGQLPPIGDTKFSLMKNPEYILKDIHRQSLNSPIINLSKFVRNEGYIPFGVYSNEVFKFSWKEKRCQEMFKKIDFTDENLISLCGFNITRSNINKMVRNKLNFNEVPPYPGEKIVCLSNDHTNKIMNGQIGKVVWVMANKKSYMITIEINDSIYECFVAARCFGESKYTIYDKSLELKNLFKQANSKGFSLNFFDYGYAISVHKSQGSEWNKVILFEQRTKRWEDDYYAKWLYTAITRSKEKLFIISDYWG